MKDRRKPESTRRANARWRRLAAVALGTASLALPVCSLAARPPEPIFSVALEDLGYHGVPPRYLLAGDTVFAVHFVDATHLLVTFTSRGLLTRLPDAQETDLDQNVSAVLLELPTGKVLGRTTWRERDHGQYLWAIGHGRFILRVRSKLTLLDPLSNLAAGKPFEEGPFLEIHRKVGFITVSPTGDLLSIETTPEPKPKPKMQLTGASTGAGTGLAAAAAGTSSTEDGATEAPPGIQINFFRLTYTNEPGPKDRVAAPAKPETRADKAADVREEKVAERAEEKAEKAAGIPAGGATERHLPPVEHLVVSAAGVVRARNFIDIPATGDGYLDILKESRGVFLFDFQPHGEGKRVELSPFDSTCAPHPHFIGPANFIAFGCRGSDDKQEMAGFNLRGEEGWVTAFPNHHVFPFLLAAPAAGRFALSRTLLTGTYIDLDNLAADQISGQEISVMQGWDGRTLFKMNATPFQRAGQNFDVSPDGLEFAIVRDEKVQVFRLPPLSPKDEDALKMAAAAVPAHSLARINLGGKPASASGTPEEKTANSPGVGAPATVATEQVASQTQVQTAGQAQVKQAQEPSQTQNGDVDPAQQRAAPSLYDKDHPKDPDSKKPPDGRM